MTQNGYVLGNGMDKMGYGAPVGTGEAATAAIGGTNGDPVQETFWEGQDVLNRNCRVRALCSRRMRRMSCRERETGV
jgi:hypothetical protein